jgi:hypothetical protein
MKTILRIVHAAVYFPLLVSLQVALVAALALVGLIPGDGARPLHLDLWPQSGALHWFFVYYGAALGLWFWIQAEQAAAEALIPACPAFPGAGPMKGR